MKRVTYALILVAVMALLGGFSGHLLAGLMGDGTSSVTVTVIAQPLYSSSPAEGADGGVAGWDGGAECPAGGTPTAGKITAEGLVIQPIIIKSFDERLCLTIDVGTTILFPDGACPRCIGLYEVTTLPPPPEEACIIGVMYDAFPDGAIFAPPAILQCSYDPIDIAEGIAGECLAVACYDQISGEWIKQGCVVDTEANTITAEVSQFYDPAVLGYEPAPAAFEVVSLHVSPAEVAIGETVNITVLVANTGGQPGSYQVALKINVLVGAGGEVASMVEADREVTIDAGASKQISFTTSRDTPGLYLVEVNGLTGSFEVKQPLSPVEPTPVKPTNWWLIGGIIAAVAIAAFVIFLRRVGIF